MTALAIRPYVPKGTTHVSVAKGKKGSDEELAYRGLVNRLGMLEPFLNILRQQDAYVLAHSAQRPLGNSAKTHRIRSIAEFHCEAVEGVHPAYSLFLVMHDFIVCHGRVQRVTGESARQLIAVLDGISIDLKQCTDKTGCPVLKSPIQTYITEIETKLLGQVAAHRLLRLKRQRARTVALRRQLPNHLRTRSAVSTS